jgi:hypothetical protein
VDAFESIFADAPHYRIGAVMDQPFLRVEGAGGLVVNATLENLRAAWKAPLAW